MTTIGVDPGLTGGLVTYDKARGVMRALRMPVMMQTVGKTKRERLDIVTIRNHLELETLRGVDICVTEAVWGRPKMSAKGNTILGYCLGVIMGCCICLQIPVETVAPAAWKRMLKVPSKSGGQTGDVIARADTLMPRHADLWRGPKGGLIDGIAEAALIAYFGEVFVLNSADPARLTDPEFRALFGPHPPLGAPKP